MSSVSPAEQKELDLIEKVELRLALSDTTEKFEKSLGTFLAPLLLKLASPYSSVRQAVFNTLKHVLSRLSSLKELRLPVAALILQAKNPTLPPNTDPKNVRMYSLLLASKGIDRLTVTEQKALVPEVMRGMSQLPRDASARLFHILCKLLLQWTPPMKGSSEENEIKDLLRMDDKRDLDFILDLFTKFFMLRPARPNPQAGVIARGYTCPGLSIEDVSFFTYDAGATFTGEQMYEFKRAIFRFACNGLVDDDNQLVKFLSVACTDESNISDSAIQFLKRLQTPYEDRDFIDFLMKLYIGDKSVGIPPVKHELQERIMAILNNSIVATEDAERVLLICSIGLNSDFYKLKSLCLLFVRHVARNNHENLLTSDEKSRNSDYRTNIASLIRNNLHSEGWPKLQLGASTPQFSNAILQRRLQYETLGDILMKDGELTKDLSYIEFLFDSLKGDMSEFSVSIQESLVSASVHLRSLPESSKDKLRVLLKRNLSDDYELESDPEMKDKIMALRFISIKFANAAFEFSDPQARFFNILGTSRTNKFDVIEEAVKGLHPHWFRINEASLIKTYLKTEDILATKVKNVAFPSSRDMCNLIITELKEENENPTAVLRSTLNFAVRFMRQCIITEAVGKETTIIVQDEDWSVRIEKAVEVDPTVISLVSVFVQGISDPWFAELLKILCTEFVQKSSNGEHTAMSKYDDPIFGQTFYLLTKFSNADILGSVEPLIMDLYSYLDGVSVLTDERLELCSNILGVLATACRDSITVTDIISRLDQENTSDISMREIFANSYILPRLFITNQTSNVTESRVLTLINTISNKILEQKSRKVLFGLMGQISKFGLLCHLPKAKREIIVKSTMELLKTRLLNDEVTTSLWGSIAVYAGEFGLVEEFYNTLFQTHTSKHVEFLFTAGESFSIISGGWKSSVLIDQVDVGQYSQVVISELGSKFYQEQNVELVILKILDACNATKPSQRKASCIWLLSMVQFLKNNPVIIKYSKDIHLRFMKFLADNDDMIQDTASRGLAIIYEIGNNDLQEEMVKGLLKSFTNTTDTASMQSGSLDQETQLFEPGVMNTGDGSVSTYKDILNLASEVGDPSLVYKFMSLAKSTSLWSSRKGIAFGLGAIMSKSSLEKLLLNDQATASKLIPKLYRYRFDPFTTVSRTMTDIWNSLITDSATIISVYFDNILNELLSGMSNKEWRVREASTLGLLNLMQTQPENKFSDKILDIWTMGFRTMDDIKESVREAGLKFTTSLSKILARSIDVNKGVSPEKSKQILEIILPFFLGTKGINSDAEDVRKFALTTLLELVKNTGDSIKPFAPQLVYEFTLLFSSIEPQVINYLSLNANNYNVDSKVIDMHRKNGITGSPLYETIDKLVSRADDSNLLDFVDYSMKAVKKSIGLPSKVASAQLITLLTKRFTYQLTPYSGKLLKLCLLMLDDRNESVALSFAVTFGFVFRIASTDKCVKYSEKLVEKYSEDGTAEEATANKKVVGSVIESILDHAPSQFENIAGVFMPLIFIGSNDVNEENGKLFSKIWTDASSTGASTIKLYLDEILKLLSQNIASTNFDTRRTCAKSLLVVSEKVDNSISDVIKTSLFDLVIEALNCRTWDGKEMMTESLISLVQKFRTKVEHNPELKPRIDKTLKTEISRNNKAYVKKIVVPYATYLGLFKDDSGTVDELIKIVDEIITTAGAENLGSAEDAGKNGNGEVSQSDITKKSSKGNIETEEYILKLINACVPFATISRTNVNFKIEYLQFVLEKLSTCLSNGYFIYTWRSQLACCDIGKALIENFSNLDHVDMSSVLNLLEGHWAVTTKFCCTKETVENVKIQVIGFAALLVKKIPEFKPAVNESMRLLLDIDPTQRLTLELKNAGF